ncbi:MAG: DUF1461 domain-containing protein [Candidatus Woesearchaeota archaeon]|nr:DUF1461 domain-containing protein [Candidatus Woesearchaeota archaeon]
MARTFDKKHIGTIFFPLLCLLLSFFILLSDSHFTYSLLEKNESIQPTKELMSYLISKGQMPEVFNAEEQSHLQDVKQLIRFGFIALLMLLLLMLYSGYNAKQGTIILICILAAGVIIPFDALFTKFHQIFFPQGNWTFAVDSTLITFYPQKFFSTYALSTAIFAVFIALILIHFKIVSRRG